MRSLASILHDEDITIISAGKLYHVIYCENSEGFTSVVKAIHKECANEIKEKRIKLENSSSYPSYCLGITFKAKSDESFFLLKAN